MITAGKTARPTSARTTSAANIWIDGDHHHRHGADGHRQRRDRPPGRFDVGVRVRQQLAGRVPLVPLHREREVLAGDRAAVVRLHAVLHDAGAEPTGDDADGAQDGDAEEEGQDRPEQGAVHLAGAERREHRVVGGPAEHPRVGHGQGAEEEAADRGQGEDDGFALDRDQEYGESVPRRRPAWLRLRVRHLGALPPPVRRTSDGQGIPRPQPLTSEIGVVRPPDPAAHAPMLPA